MSSLTVTSALNRNHKVVQMLTLFLVIVAALVVVLYALPMILNLFFWLLSIAFNLLLCAAVVVGAIWLLS